jgi:hypothetical protein
VVRRTAIAAGAVYFLLVFAAGFVLGTMRVLLVVPHLGERRAELLEIPVMLVIAFVAARWVVGRWRIDTTPARLVTGGVALALLAAAEIGVVLSVRGETLAAYVAGRDPVAGTAYGLSLLLFSAMPLLVSRENGA